MVGKDGLMEFKRAQAKTKTVYGCLTVHEYCNDGIDRPLDGALAHLDGIFGPKVNKGFHELLFVVSGTLEIDVEGRRFMLEQEDVFILPPFTVHSIRGL